MLPLRYPTKQYANPRLQNRRIRRKTDMVILSILTWVYFLQVRCALRMAIMRLTVTYLCPLGIG